MSKARFEGMSHEDKIREQTRISKAVAALKRIAEEEKKRLDGIAKNWFIKLRGSKGINKRTDDKGNILLGKSDLLELEIRDLDNLSDSIGNDPQAKKIEQHLTEIEVRIRAFAIIMHHKRYSKWNQLKNKMAFIIAPAIVGFSLGGPIGAGIGALIGWILNLTELGKYFAGQAMSQGNWEANSDVFSSPKDEPKTLFPSKIVLPVLHKVMKETLPHRFLQSSGKRGRAISSEYLHMLRSRMNIKGEIITGNDDSQERKPGHASTNPFSEDDVPQESAYRPRRSPLQAHSITTSSTSVAVAVSKLQKGIECYEDLRRYRLSGG